MKPNDKCFEALYRREEVSCRIESEKDARNGGDFCKRFCDRCEAVAMAEKKSQPHAAHTPMI